MAKGQKNLTLIWAQIATSSRCLRKSEDERGRESPNLS